jgi:hypothetical protein
MSLSGFISSAPHPVLDEVVGIEEHFEGKFLINALEIPFWM